MATLALVVAALAIVGCLARVPVSRPPRLRRRKQRTTQAAPEQLLDTEQLVRGAAGSQRFAHAYLRPVLAEIAGTRLVAHGWTLATIPESTAHELLGDRLWELVAPGRQLPVDERHGHGVSEAELSEMLDALAAL